MTKSFIEYAWILFQFIIGYNLILPIMLYFFYALTKQRKITSLSESFIEADYAIIVTAYEQTTHLFAVVESLLAMDYKKYIIYIVADSCDISSLYFKDERVIVLRPVNSLKSNVKSHFYAIDNFIRNHERLTIIDSDNLVKEDYLKQLNIYFNKGYVAVQGPRMPKNLNTTYACLDAARDIYYHFYDGKILFGLGSSATLAGSGMAFQTDLYISCLKIHSQLSGAGFDKVLQAEIVIRNLRIAFAEDAIVYDEKTTHATQLVSQRARWINTWFKYFKYGFSLIGSGIVRLSKNQLLFGITLLRPPLFMFIITSFVCLIINLFIHPLYSLIWMVAFFIFILGFYISLAKSNTDKLIYKSLINIPVFMFYQVISLLKSGKQKGNIATRHFVVSDKINNIP